MKPVEILRDVIGLIRTCPNCHGVGRCDDGPDNCGECAGQGAILPNPEQVLKQILAAHECEWKRETHGSLASMVTSCGIYYNVSAVGAFKFCPFCGGMINEVVK